MSIRRFKKIAALAALVASLGSAAHAATITGTLIPVGDTSLTSALGTDPANITLPTGIQSIAGGAIEQGPTSSGVYAKPDGLDDKQVYLVSNPNLSAPQDVTVTFTSSLTSLSLLWGSLDTYNTLTLSDGAGHTDTVTGTAVGAALHIPFVGSNSNPPGPNGQTAIVNLSNIQDDTTHQTFAFNTAVFTSSQAAFEFTFITPVPEPASMAMCGTALLGVTGVVLRRRKIKAAL
jgi:hypothetical protein